MSVDGGNREVGVISLQIPDGAEPGDSLSFEANGQNFAIEVPIASIAGEILQIQFANYVGENDISIEDSDVAAEKNVDDSKITIEMVTGSRISIIQDLQTETPSKTLSDGTYRMLWPASRFVVKFLNTPDFSREILSSQVHSVMELGAGHGMLGMAFINIASSFNTTDKVVKLVLTDVEEALPQLDANIRMNRQVFGKRVDVTTLPLKWHSQPIHQTSSNLDFILGSDLLYNCSVIPDLVATIRRLACKLTPTKILFSIRWRKPSEERSFFILLSDIIDWKLVHGNCSLDYRFYGNGSFESNKYFSQSMVSIKGKIVPLSSIDEKSCEQMNANEFERFEELQTQIYLGEVREKRVNRDHERKRLKL